MDEMIDQETRSTLDAVDRFNEAFNRHDVDAVMASMTDDCVFESTSPPDGDHFDGQASVRTVWEGFFASTPTANLALLNARAESGAANKAPLLLVTAPIRGR